MSENIRLVVIVLFFLVGGALLWNFQFRETADVPDGVRTTSAPEPKQATRKVDAQYPEDVPKEEASAKKKVTLASQDPGKASKSSSKASPSGKGKLKGKVDMTDGSPVPSDLVITLHYVPDEARYDGAHETAFDDTEADSEKKFEFSDLPMGNFVVFGNSATHTGTFNYRLNNSTRDRVYTLSLYPSTFISGSVVNTSGEALDDAHVFVAGYLSAGNDLKADLYRSRASGVPTDENGAFHMASLQIRAPALQYRLLASAPGFAPTVTDLIATGATGVQIVLSEGATISGHVINQDSGDPVANAPLTASLDYAMAAGETKTDKEGAFTLAGLAAGKINFNVETDNDVITPETSTVELKDQEAINDLIINVRTGAIIRGRLFDTESGLGIAGATINADPERIPTAERKDVVTDAAGNFAMKGLHAGQYQVRYSDVEGYSTNQQWEDRQQVVTALGQTISGIDFELTQGITLSGIIVDEEGNPIPSMAVSGQSPNSNTYDSKRVDENGRFKLAGFKPHTNVNLRPYGSGYAGTTKLIKIEETSVENIELVMGTEATISGKVFDTNGSPVVGQTFYAKARQANSRYEQSRSAAEGAVKFDQLAEGTYDIKHQATEYSYSNSDPILETISISKGQQLEGVRLILEKSALGDMFSISGRIIDDAGAPVPSVSMYSWGAGGRNVRASSDRDGRFTLADLPEGDYQVQFDSNKHMPKSERMTAGTTDSEIVMTRVGKISGKIVQASNQQPVIDFSLFIQNGNRNNGNGPEYRRFHHEEGIFELDGAHPNGTATLLVRATGYADANVTLDGVISGETRSDVLVQLETENIVTGQVVNSRGDGVKNAWVFKGEVPRNSWQRDRAEKITTDGNGRFELAGMARGNQTITAYKNGYAPSEVSVNVNGNNSNVRLELNDGATVSGTVLSAGKAMPNVNLYGNISGDGRNYSDFRGTSDDNGNFEIRGVAEGNGNITANINENGTQRSMNQQIEVVNGMNTEVHFAFEVATSTVEGYVMKSESETAAGQVSLNLDMGGNTESRWTEVGANGHYLFESLPAGTVKLSFYNRSVSGQKMVTGEVGENETLRLDINLYGGTTVYCRVENLPDGNNTGAFLIPAASAGSIPKELTMVEYRELSQLAVAYGQMKDGVVEFLGVEKGAYTVLVVAFPPNTQPTEMASAQGTITVADQSEIEMSVSF